MINMEKLPEFLSSHWIHLLSAIIGITLAILLLRYLKKESSNRQRIKNVWFKLFKRGKDQFKDNETPLSDGIRTAQLELSDTPAQQAAEVIDWAQKYSNSQHEIKVLKKKISMKDEIIEELKESVESALVIRQAQEGSENVSNYRRKVPRYFYSEAMVAAGPRKEAKEQFDFAEDICGVVQTKDKALFWLLDGTSQQGNLFANEQLPEKRIEVFSSRLMAVSIAKALPEIFVRDKSLDARTLSQKAVTQVAEEWVKRFAPYKQHLIGFKCSTTLIIGTLDLNGKLDAFVIGDSRLLMFDANKNYLNYPENTNTVQSFVSAVKEGQLKLHTGKDSNGNPVQGVLAPGKHIRRDGVWSLICHSDGVSERRSEKIQQLSKEGFSRIKEALNGIPMNTQDDKSLLILEVKNS